MAKPKSSKKANGTAKIKANLHQDQATVPIKALPVTLLSGFLGSGKTTLLQHILRSEHGLRIAVIVNDIGAVNVDANLIRNTHTLTQTQEKVIALQNGCICCTLRGDLLEELVRLSELASFDYIIVESSGISEPGQVAETFDARLAEQIGQMGDGPEGLDRSTLDTLRRLKDAGGLEKFARLDTTVTVIDAFTIFQDFETVDLLSSRRNDVTPEDERTVSDLMVDQIEFSDVVVLNKVDLVSANTVHRVRTLVKKLNHRAKVIECRYGKIEAGEIVNTGMFDLEKAQTGSGWLQDLHEMTLREVQGKMVVTPKPETEEYNVRNFVYVRRRPFHPRRLFELLHDKFILQHPLDEMEDEAMASDSDEEESDDVSMTLAPELPDPDTILATKRTHHLFARLFRSKGEHFLATRPYRAGEWSQAGAMLTLSGGRPWFCTIDRSEWETGNGDIDAMVEHDIDKGGVWGDRRQELVFIGENLDVTAVSQVFDECLLNEEEFAKWTEVMMAGDGPNVGSQEEKSAKEHTLAEMFEDGFPDWDDDDEHEHDHDHDHGNEDDDMGHDSGWSDSHHEPVNGKAIETAEAKHGVRKDGSMY